MKNTSLDIISLRDTARPAGMPMYVMPEIENMLNRWWQGLGRHLREAGVKRVPDRLERPDNLTIHWLNKDLLFSQTCGFPLTHILDNNVTLVAVPVYNVPGCEGIMYCSMIIVRNDLQASSLADLRNSN